MFFINPSNHEEFKKYEFRWGSLSRPSFDIGKVRIFGNIQDNEYVVLDSTKCYVGYNLKNIKNINKNICLIASLKAKIDTDIPVIRVANLAKFIDIVLKQERLKYNGKLITITGSVGKTSTTRLVNSSLELFGSTHLSIKHNLRNGIYSKLNTIGDQNFAIFEVALGALNSVPSVLVSDISVLLSITEAHIERYNNIEELALQKAKIFEGSSDGAKAVINSDLPFFEKFVEIAKNNNREVVTYGSRDSSIFQLMSFKDNILQFKFTKQIFVVKIPVLEQHQAFNFLANIAILESLGLDWKSKLNLIADKVEIEEGRGNHINFNMTEKNNITFIDHAYNSSPLALTSCVYSFNEKNMLKGKKIVVLSDMLELGNDSHRLHQDAIYEILSYESIEFFLVTGKQFTEVSVQNDKFKKFNNMEDLFYYLNQNLGENDFVMFKGSNGTGLRNKMLTFIHNNKVP